MSHKLESIQEIAGAAYSARVGILKDYDNIWDCQTDRWHERVDRVSQKSLFTALQRAHVPFDYIYLDGNIGWEKLKEYDVLFYPHASILTKERTALLERYVAEGGKLVVGCRTGYKEKNGKCVTDRLPGLAAALTGTDIPEYSFVAPDEGKVTAEWDGERMEAAVFNDLLMPAGENAEVLATYADSYYAGTPALIRNRFGKGEAYYFGGAFALDTAELFVRKLGIGEPYGGLMEIPAGCELAVREKEGTKYLFVLNYGKEPAEVVLKTELRELLSGESCRGMQTLEPYGVRIYKK